jgi:hypothetical protein
LKIAKIRPVSKKDNRQEINNYRPIFVLSKFSRILEKVDWYLSLLDIRY